MLITHSTIAITMVIIMAIIFIITFVMHMVNQMVEADEAEERMNSRSGYAGTGIGVMGTLDYMPPRQ